MRVFIGDPLLDGLTRHQEFSRELIRQRLLSGLTARLGAAGVCPCDMWTPPLFVDQEVEELMRQGEHAARLMGYCITLAGRRLRCAGAPIRRGRNV